MQNAIEDNVVLCPNPSCRKIFNAMYSLNHICPFCNTPYFPSDTMAGCPMKDTESQIQLAEAFKGDE